MIISHSGILILAHTILQLHQPATPPNAVLAFLVRSLYSMQNQVHKGPMYGIAMMEL